MSKMNPAERAKLGKTYKELVAPKLPARLAKLVQGASPSQAIWLKLHFDMELAGLDADVLFPFVEGSTYRLPEEAATSLKPLRDLAVRCRAKLSDDDNALAIAPNLQYGVPQGDARIEMIRLMLETAGADKVAEGRYTLHGVEHDVNTLTIGKKAQGEAFVFGPFGGKRLITDPVTVMYLRISVAMAATNFGKTADQYSGLLGVSTVKAAQSKYLGHSDGLHAAWSHGKVGELAVCWGPFGFQFTSLLLEKPDVIRQVMVETKGKKGAHNQGSYMGDSAAFGTHVTDDGRVFGVGDLAKGFARGKQATPIQCLLLRKVRGAYTVQMDTSHFKGLTKAPEEGRRAQVLIGLGAISLPYPGGCFSLKPVKERSEDFTIGVPTEVQDTLSGRVDLTIVVKAGDTVKEGDVLATGYAAPITAPCEGLVVSVDGPHVDTTGHQTTYSIVLATPDGSCQLKIRRHGMKYSVHQSAFTGVNWALILPELEKLGYTLGAPSRIVGDLALWGLRPGDDPVDFIHEDGNKGTKNGAYTAEVALAADTLHEDVQYSVETHLAGGYADQLDRLHKRADRIVAGGFSVDPDTAAQLRLAVDSGVANPNMKVHDIVVAGRTYHIALQIDIPALCVETILKVECLPVSASVSTGRIPLEVARAPRGTTKLDRVSAWLIDGRKEAAKELHALLRAVSGKLAGDTMTLANGLVYPAATLNDGSKIPAVRLSTLDDTLRGRFATLQADPLGLKTAMAIVDDLVQDEDEQTLIILDPEVIQAFGSGTEDGGLKALLRNLFAELSDPAFLDNARRTLRRTGGSLKALAKSGSVLQRVNRGVRTVQAKSRAGFIRSGWIALSYYGSVANHLARQAGIDTRNDPDALAALFGARGFVYRAPQNMPLFARFYFPDAPEHLWEQAVAQGLVPDGAVPYGGIMEPDTFAMSPVDVAFDHGDKDGDGRNLVILPLDDVAMHAEVDAWISVQHAFRKEVIGIYKAE